MFEAKIKAGRRPPLWLMGEHICMCVRLSPLLGEVLGGLSDRRRGACGSSIFPNASRSYFVNV
jgi:hypothetical protein